MSQVRVLSRPLERNSRSEQPARASRKVLPQVGREFRSVFPLQKGLPANILWDMSIMALLSPADVAAQFDVTPACVHYWIRKKLLPAERIGKRAYVIHPKDAQKFKPPVSGRPRGSRK